MANKHSLIKINLLPPERARMNFKWLPKAALFSLLAVIMLGVLSANAYYVVLNMGFKQLITEVNAEIAEIQDDVARVREIQQEIAVLHKKETIINDLIVNRIEWARKLNQLSDIMPAQVWLEEVTLVTNRSRAARSGESARVLKIVGVTRALQHARSLEAALIYNIQQSPFMDDFDAVQLVRSLRTEWSGDRNETVWQFELNLPLKEVREQTRPGTPGRETRSANRSA